MLFFKYTLTCLLVFATLLSKASDGLYFQSKQVAKELRTGVDITHESTISYDEYFSLQFDILFRMEETSYGDILSLKETSKDNTIQLRYHHPFLYLIHNRTKTKTFIDVSKVGNGSNRWNNARLTIDSKRKNLQFTFCDTTINTPLQFPKESELQITLGAISKYGFIVDETPPISIKYFDIRIDRKVKHQWTFRKTEQDLLTDRESKLKAKLYNPKWEIDQHNHWKHIKTLEFSSLPTVVFDKEMEDINFIFFSGDIGKYDLRNQTFSTVQSKTGYPTFEKAQQAIINARGEILTYSFEDSVVSAFNKNDARWSSNKKYFQHTAPRLWHHNKLINPWSSNLTTLCGYGYYAYTNSINEYNSAKKEWSPIKFSGDTLYPRYLSAIGPSTTEQYTYFLFGGAGNKQGKQIYGREIYTDLYKIDFANHTIKRCAEFENKEQLLPVQSIKLDENDDCFYSLMYPSLKSKTYLKAVKGSVSKGELTFIGDSIPYTFTDIASFADMYYWDKDNKLVALTLEEIEDSKKYKVKLYTIAYAPVDNIIKEEEQANSAPIIVSVILILSTLLGVYLHWKKKNTPITNEIFEDLEEDDIPTFDVPHTNAIMIFGGFRAFDSKGKDITYRFSPIVKELFLLIMLHSHYGEKGISSRRIQEYLWPDKTDANAKNNRGVNIKKIRDILVDIPGVQVVYDKNYWSLNYNENIFCDLNFIIDLTNDTEIQDDYEKLWRMVHVLKRGMALRDLSTEWVDSHKDKITEVVVSFMEEILEKTPIKNQLHLEIAETIFEFDAMNETALKIKCQLLANQGKHSIAVQTYDNYCKIYEKYYSEGYQRSFKDIISK